MQYGSIAGLSKSVSRLIHGAIALNNETAEREFPLLDKVFEYGCTTFDTAYIYGGGQTDVQLGRWIRERGIRDKVVILAKGAHPGPQGAKVTPEDITSDLNETLERMQLDNVDLYVLHRDDESVPVGPIVEILNQHLKAGKISAFGGSNWTHERIGEANAYALAHGLVPFAATNPNYSLAAQIVPPWEGCVTVSGPENAEARAWYAEQKISVLAWSSLASGFFSGRISRNSLNPPSELGGTQEFLNETCRRSYCSEENFQRLDRVKQLAHDNGATIPQVALAYIFHSPMNVFALTASANADEFLSNIDALDLTLSAAEVAWLDNGTPIP
ncbi:hypothetical protein CCAX7_005230 [Capsulimonas corticalis]|uniref:Uncharacterized protein n=1 Tax=Capsulimonas corticalis TaxID=2219043 RepID=A0A402D323_9BACT|nr:aldo/keto reductase [Capsulimonas corticalis]BDI28472.1 hypothetical protein CCAX7_005230 [Capsulimonas corticalis]